MPSRLADSGSSSSAADDSDSSSEGDEESSQYSSSDQSSLEEVDNSKEQPDVVANIALGQRLLEQDKLGGIKNALKRGKNFPKRKAKKSKHAPAEVSSRRRMKFDINANGLSVEIGKHRYQPRDPRAQTGAKQSGQNAAENEEFFRELREKEIKSIRQRMKAHKATGRKGSRLRKKTGPIDVEGDSNLLQRLQTAAAADRHQNRQQAALSAIRQERGKHYRPKVRELRERIQSSSSSKKKRKKNKSKDASIFPV